MPDTAQLVAENIWHSTRLCVSQTSVGLAINCFLWDKTQAPLPSVENHLMEGVVTLRPISSHDWLTALPHHLSPLLSAVCLDQAAPASISDFQSISETAPFTVVCPSVGLRSTFCWWVRKHTSLRKAHPSSPSVMVEVHRTPETVLKLKDAKTLRV